MASLLSTALPTTHVAFVVNNLPDLDTLLDGLPQGTEVHLLDHERNGLTQMAEKLRGRSGVDALHLFCHGAPGELHVGSATLQLLSLPRYSDELDTLSTALAADGQWMMYGCDVAAGNEGLRFIEALRLMTGVQIAAASHKVGAKELGGSWELDYGMAGKQKALAVPQWQGVLPASDTTPPTVTLVKAGGTSVTLIFNEALEATYIAPGSAFAVKVNGSPATLDATTPVAVSGSTVTLLLANALLATDVVTVDYTAPTVDNAIATNAAIQDTAGNDALGIVGHRVNGLGGDAATGNLWVNVAIDGTIIIDRYDGTTWNTQFFKDMTNGQVSSGSVLDINGVTVALGTYSYQSVSAGSTVTDPIISTTGSTITTTWTIDPSVVTQFNLSGTTGNLLVEQKVTLASDTAQSVSIEWKLINNTGIDLTNVRFAHLVDSFLAGGDTGSGFWVNSTKTVGVTKTTSSGIQQLTLTSVGSNTPVDAESQDVGQVLTDAATTGAGLVTSTGIDAAANTDNGYGMEWVISLNNGESTTIQAVESFVSSSVIASKTTDGTGNIGTPIDLTFTIENVSGVNKDVSYQVVVPDGWTPPVISTTTALPGVDDVNTTTVFENQAIITVTVTPPAGATIGANDIVLKATTGNTTVTANGVATVSAPPNVAPTSTADSVTTNEDSAIVLAATDFGTFADANGDTLQAVKITTLPTAGSLEYYNGITWVAVTLNQVISKADIDTGKLHFAPVANANGDGYATVGFKVSDGMDFSASAYDLTVNVTAVNDAPVIHPLELQALFAGRTAALGTELYITDGTLSGTSLVKDIVSGTGSGISTPYFASIGSKVVFNANGNLYITDGTSSGTTELLSSGGASVTNPTFMTQLGSKVVFRGTSASESGELWITDGTQAGTVMIKDIAAGAAGSYPSNLCVVGSNIFFTADDQVNGQELWVSDGTTAGTVLVKNINVTALTGSNPLELTAFGNKLLFTADNGTNGREVWVSDGTTAGTTLLQDIYAGATGAVGTVSGERAAFGVLDSGKAVFFADNGSNGRELWITDGTTANTLLLKDINGTTATLTNSWFAYSLGSKVIFGQYNTTIYSTDGTSGGTIKLSGVNANGVWWANLDAAATVLNGKLYFQGNDQSGANTEPWVTDGTVAGTVRLKDTNPSGNSGAGSFTVFGDKVLFSAWDATNGTEAWVTDGTTAGTSVIDFVTGANGIRDGIGSSYFSSFLKAVANARGSNFITIAEDVADGSNVGNTVAALVQSYLITDPDVGTAPKAIAVSAVDNTHGVWQYKIGAGTWSPIDLTANTGKALLLDSVDSVRFVPTSNWNGTVANGISFYAWDKTGADSAGSYLTVSGNTGGANTLSTLTASSGVTVTPVNDAPVGTPNVTGTPSVGQILTAVTSGISDADGLGNLAYKWQSSADGNTWGDIGNATSSAYTVTSDLAGKQVRVQVSYTDQGGTAESAVSTATTVNTPPTLSTFAAAVDTVAEDTEVELTFAELTAQGNEAGSGSNTVTAFVVKSVSSGALIIGADAAGAQAWAAGSNDVIDASHQAYWTPASNVNGDGISAFAVVAKDSVQGVSATPIAVAVNVTPVNDPPVILSSIGKTNALFAGHTAALGTELYITDGTLSGTSLVKDIVSGTGSGISTPYFASIGSKVVFNANGNLYITDGTSSGTTELLSSGGASVTNPTFMTQLGSKVVFRGTSASESGELWITDGTQAGTVMIKDIAAGAAGSYPSNLCVVGSNIFFTADDQVNGQELWVSDGTTAGTVLVKNINVTALTGSNPLELTAFGNKLLFTADNGTNGREVWVSDGTTAGTTLLQDIYAGATGAVGTVSGERAAFGVLDSGKAVFFADNGSNGRELWITDGTTANTLLLKDINGTTATLTNSWFAYSLGSKVIFGQYNTTIYSTDGTSGGTIKLSGVNANGVWWANLDAAATVLNGKLYFQGNDQSGANTEPWVTDGTVAGTVRLKDTNPSGNSGAGSFTVFGDKVLFSAWDATNGTEAWVTDGTTAGTSVIDFVTGANGISPSYFSSFLKATPVPAVLATLTEGSNVNGSGQVTASGAVYFADPETADRPTVSFSIASVAALRADGTTAFTLTSAQQSAVEAAFAVQTAAGNTNSGSADWTYVIADSALDFLAAGEKITAVFTIKITDALNAQGSQNITVNLIGTNDAPVLDATQSPTLTGISVNISDANNTGTTVGAMVVNGSITDVDIANQANVPKAIIVETVDNTHGVWQFKIGAGSWTNFVTVGTPLNNVTGTGIVLNSTDLIRFVPATDYAGDATITFDAWDTTDGKTSGSYTTFVGNTSAGYSLASDTASITVTPDTTPPVFTSATVSGSTLVLTYGEALDATNIPAASTFTVTAGGTTQAAPTNVVVDSANKTITLTLAAAVINGQTVTVSYTDPTANNDANAIQDLAGNDAITLTSQAVSNNTPDTTAPAFSSATVNGTAMVLTYGEALDATNIPAATTFTVTAGGTTQAAPSNVVVNSANKTVTLTLAAAVTSGQSVTVSYTDPTTNNDANAIQDAAGNDAISLTNQTVSNNTPTPPQPVFINSPPSGSVTISGTATQGQTLTAANTLADPDGLGTISYQWQAGGTNIAGANAATFTLTQAEVGKTITVKAGYTDGRGTAESVASGTTATVTNINDLPTGAVLITDTATQGETLTASNTLADVDGLGTISYQWQAGGTNIAGANAATFTLTQAEVGKTITVKASYTDGTGTAESVASGATATVANINDAPTGSVTITGTAKQHCCQHPGRCRRPRRD